KDRRETDRCIGARHPFEDREGLTHEAAPQRNQSRDEDDGDDDEIDGRDRQSTHDSPRDTYEFTTLRKSMRSRLRRSEEAHQVAHTPDSLERESVALRPRRHQSAAETKLDGLFEAGVGLSCGPHIAG